MSIYDVNYKKTTVQILPPDKRYRFMVAWIQTLVALPLQWLLDLWMGDYRTGATAVAWIPASSYNKYDRVLFKQKVYESLIDNNTSDPTDQSAWMVIQQNFIGVFERVLYNGNKLVFEYAINKFFGSSFRQPPNTSDIYISVFQKPYDVFVIGGDEGNSSVVYGNSSSEFIINEYDFNAYYNMSVNVPASLFNTLDPDPANCEKIVRNFADKYINAGILYQVTTY